MSATPSTEIQTCTAGPSIGRHRWYCHDCRRGGPAEADGRMCKWQLAVHLKQRHGFYS